MARLGINVDHVATLRQARGGRDPDPVTAAVFVEQAGADGIVVHLREDRRHIQDHDLKLLREVLHTKLDMEMAPTDDMVKIARSIRPHLVTLVPERREELTTEGGLQVIGMRDHLESIINQLHESGIAVSLFTDPDIDAIKIAHKVNADYIEIHTGRYANARLLKEENSEFNAIEQTAKLAYKLGLGVAAGHGLNYHNVRRLVQITEIVEYNIGHAVISRAVIVGLERAVKEMKELLQ